MNHICKIQFFLIIAVFCIVSIGSAETVHLKWSAPTDGGPVSGYNLYYGVTDNIANMTKIDGINGTTYTLDNLQLHKKYYFYIQAYNSHGEGPISEVKDSNVSLRVVK